MVHFAVLGYCGFEVNNVRTFAPKFHEVTPATGSVGGQEVTFKIAGLPNGG